MAREDDWNDERRWNYERERRQADYGQERPRYGDGYDDERRPGYRAAREDAWQEERRRQERSFAPLGPGPDREHERAFSPFGTTGPTAYGPYGEGAYARGPASATYGYGAPYAGGGYGSARTEGYGGSPRDPGPNRYGLGGGDRGAGDSRSFLDKAADEVSSWFGDHSAERRRRDDELRASHRGRGPKGYKRSDARILEDINERLTEDPYLDASDIEVEVKDGDVILKGMAPSREDKRRAERLAEEVSGVGDVQNNLRLRRYDDDDACAAVATGPKPPAGNS